MRGRPAGVPDCCARHGALLLGALAALLCLTVPRLECAARRRAGGTAPAGGHGRPQTAGPAADHHLHRSPDAAPVRQGRAGRATSVSTGTGGFPTPTGVFSIIDKEKDHFSNIYRGASMPNMQRLTMSGVALHSGIVTGRPASHGCIRLPHAYSIRLFGLTRLGARVIIADDEVSPAAIEHPRLFKPKRPQVATIEGACWPAMPNGEQSLVAVAAALAADLQREVARAKIGEATAEREAALQGAGRVGVRQPCHRPGVRAPRLPAAVRCAGRDPRWRAADRHHVYTAMETVDDGARMRWTAVSFPKGAAPPALRGRSTASSCRPKSPSASRPC